MYSRVFRFEEFCCSWVHHGVVACCIWNGSILFDSNRLVPVAVSLMMLHVRNHGGLQGRGTSGLFVCCDVSTISARSSTIHIWSYWKKVASSAAWMRRNLGSSHCKIRALKRAFEIDSFKAQAVRGDCQPFPYEAWRCTRSEAWKDEFDKVVQ